MYAFAAACFASGYLLYPTIPTVQECAGGAHLHLSILTILLYRNALAGLTSASGRSHSFDARADGYARSEAIEAIACRLSGATSASHLACCLCLGTAVRQDGRGASLTAPNGHAQQGLLLAAIADPALLRGSVVAIEAHGTGTALGDPIEV